MSAPITLARINTSPPDVAAKMLDGLYEHTPWIVGQAMAHRPFQSLAHLKHTLTVVLDQAGDDAKKDLIRAHPELAGKAMVSNTLTAESTNEQQKAGLTQCTHEEFALIQELNAAYNAKFDWPFILAVRGPRGVGLTKQQIISTFQRRVHGHPDFELQECIRNIHRIAEIRLNDKFGFEPTLGQTVWDWQETLAQHTDPGYAELGQLTVTYLTDAHRACAQDIKGWMHDCGFDNVHIDAVGNVVGVYHPAPKRCADGPAGLAPDGAALPPVPEDLGAASPKGGPAAKHAARYLLTGSHYDTVRNGGKYDGRLGIFVPMACVRELHSLGQRLPFGIEVVAFAEEEGQRYKATFLGSGALTGHFDPAWLDQHDADGMTMRDAMHRAGLSASPANGDILPAIATLQRDPARYLGFVEVHIEQGPVLNELNLPLGVVSSINGSVRYLGEVTGQASHAGTTPMPRRRDAACAVAELTLYLEARAGQDARNEEGVVATMGQLHVPNGSINVVPGACRFSLDIRAPNDAQRNAVEADVLQKMQDICTRRGLSYKLEETMRASAAPSAAALQTRWTAAVQATGLPVFNMPSGAGHDAMKLHDVMPQAMLFVRGENSGISHNPLESTTADDMQLTVDAFSHLLQQLSAEKI
jgi:N-carbamoyl-L-amino-acid hydrolase